MVKQIAQAGGNVRLVTLNSLFQGRQGILAGDFVSDMKIGSAKKSHAETIPSPLSGGNREQKGHSSFSHFSHMDNRQITQSKQNE